ncbi:MAG: DeoR/GlpR transcriptional regulator [Micropruina sp.]|nr:DeoR/GlpR transcriptional regulator [Micropruina sp.]
MTIAERVVKNGSASIEELVELTGVSAMTVYRDIEALEEAGVLLRHRGQVTAVATGLNEIAASIRVNQNAELKQQVARVVARRIRPGSSIMVDDSTTALWVLRMLEVVPITVVTNSMLVARELERRSGVRLFVTGGEYQSWAEAMIGQTTTDVIRGIRADYALMSASGISDLQCFHPYEDCVQVKRTMMAATAESILLMDHTKLNRRALHTFATMTDFDQVVLDSETPDHVIDELRDRGVRIVKAPA